MLKDTVSIDVQSFFDNNNIDIQKEIGTVFEKEPNLKNSFVIEAPYFANYKILKDCKLFSQYTSQNFFEEGTEKASLEKRLEKELKKRVWRPRCGE